MNDDKMLSEHFSWAEAVITTHREIENVIENPAVFENVTRVAVKLEKVRALLGVPLIVNSWYRCPALNVAVGGVTNSDHLSGRAVDFIAPMLGTPAEVAKKIRDNALLIGFKQLIMEHTWVHISWELIPNSQPKLEVLSLLAGGGYAKGITDKHGNQLA